MRKYMSISNPSHDRLIAFINKYYTSSGWRIISIVKGNGDFWATLEKEKLPNIFGNRRKEVELWQKRT